MLCASLVQVPLEFRSNVPGQTYLLQPSPVMAAGLLTAFVFATVVTVSFFLTEAAIAPGRVDCISENGKTINFEGVLKMKAGNRTRSLRYGQPPGRLAKTAFGHALSNERKFLSTEPRLVVRRLITGEPQRRPFFGATSSARSGKHDLQVFTKLEDYTWYVHTVEPQICTGTFF